MSVFTGATVVSGLNPGDTEYIETVTIVNNNGDVNAWFKYICITYTHNY